MGLSLLYFLSPFDLALRKKHTGLFLVIISFVCPTADQKKNIVPVNRMVNWEKNTRILFCSVVGEKLQNG